MTAIVAGIIALILATAAFLVVAAEVLRARRGGGS
jgi:hypothetical protein